MRLDKNQTEFPTEIHKTIWYCSVLILPEELSLSDKVKTLMDAELFESCKQMRLFMLHSLSNMYENAENNNFDPYQYFSIWLNIFDNILDEEIFDDRIVITSSKRIVPLSTKIKKLFDKVLDNTGVEIKINDNIVEITSVLYPQMFPAMKAMQKHVRAKKERTSMENSFQLCDFRKICPGYKYGKSEKRAYMREIEDRIPLILKSCMKPAAMEFAAYLRDKKIKLKWTGIQNTYSETGQVHIGQGLCYVGLGDTYLAGKKDGWIICVPLPNIDRYQETIDNEEMKDFIWNNIYLCGAETQADACNGGESIHGCHRGVDLMVLRKEVKYACRLRNKKNISVYVHDPDEVAIGNIKTLLELEQEYMLK